MNIEKNINNFTYNKLIIRVNTMNEQPLVSILIPYDNDEKFLEESIQSALRQSYNHIELFLLNHASADSSRDIAHSFTDKRIIHIDMPSAVSYGESGILLKEFLKKASGKYIKIFRADDKLFSNGIEKLVNFMESNPHIDFAFGDVEYIDSMGIDLRENWFSTKENFSLKNDEAACLKLYAKGISFLPPGGNIVKKDILSNIIIDTCMMTMFDMSVWVSLLVKGYKIGYLDKMVAYSRIHREQLSDSFNGDFSQKLFSYEAAYFWQLFQQIKDVELTKKIWNDNIYVQKLNNKEDISFIVAVALLDSPFRIYSYGYIVSCLNNDDFARYLEEKYNFNVSILRKLIIEDFINTKKISYKQKIYASAVKELTASDILFLLLRKFYHFITFKALRTNKDNEYIL